LFLLGKLVEINLPKVTLERTRRVLTNGALWTPGALHFGGLRLGADGSRLAVCTQPRLEHKNHLCQWKEELSSKPIFRNVFLFHPIIFHGSQVMKTKGRVACSALQSIGGYCHMISALNIPVDVSQAKTNSMRCIQYIDDELYNFTSGQGDSRSVKNIQNHVQ